MKTEGLSQNILLLFFAFMLFSGLSGCLSVPERRPFVKNGIMDLTSWDFYKDGIVKLDGDWEFYWQRLLTPEDFATNKGIICTNYLNVPGTWDRFTSGGINYPGRGCCTIRLKVCLPDTNSTLGFETGEIGTAYYLWINGRRTFQSGVVGPSEGQMLEKISYRPLYFKPIHKQIEIVIQISNFKDRHGGVWNSIYLGSEEGIYLRDQQNSTMEVILTGILLITGIYQLILFSFNRWDRSFLYFGIFCLLIGLRTALTSNFIYKIFFENLSFEYFYKMNCSIIDLAPPCFLFFLRSLFKRETSIHIISGFTAIGTALSIFALLTPVKINTYSLTVAQIVLILVVIYGFYIILLSLFRKREGSVLTFTGVMILAAVVMNDILYSNLIVNSGMIIPLGMLVYILIYDIMLSMRVAEFHKNPILSMQSDDPRIESFCEFYSISPREKEVMMLLIRGQQYIKISDRLFISMSTLKKHVNSIYTKTGTSNRLELTHLISKKSKR